MLKEAQEEASFRIGLLSLVSLALIFVVLFSRYKSAVLALIVLANIPLALIGSVIALHLAGQPLSVASMIGFITLAGIHINWLNTFQFAHAYARGEGMKHYVNMVQEPEFAAREKGYTFVSHQQEVGTGYFDDVTTVIQGGSSSVKALTGSTEEEQFH